MTRERLYDIDGTLMTMQQIVDACPNVNKHTVIARVRAGVRVLKMLRSAPTAKRGAAHPWNK